jgi:glucosamine-6-phosphate deaminase
MNLIKVQNEFQLSFTSARIVRDYINQHPGSVIVFPTGNTPLGLFEELVLNFKAGKVSFRDSSLIELDEYYDIPLTDPRNLFEWLNRELLQKVDFLPEHVYRFNSEAADPIAESRRIDRIAAELGGIDLLVLGLGINGHIGFNEPGSQPSSQTRLIQLSSESLLSSSNYWGEEVEVPKSGFTLGMSTLLKAKKTILLVQGAAKAEILNATLKAEISEEIPATYLRTLVDLTIIVDQEAASFISFNADNLT